MLHIERIGSGPRIALVHGFTQTLRSWDPIVEGIDGADVLRIDLPGHGLSGLDVPPFPDAATQIVEHIARACYVGYSMGARLCLRACIDRPEAVEKMVLISGTAGIDDPDDRKSRLRSDRELADRIEKIGLRAFLDEWLGQPMFSDLDQGSEEYRLENTAKGLAAALRMLGTGAMQPMWSDLHSIRNPTLIVAGEEDAKFVKIAHRMHQMISSSRLAIIEGAGHAPHLTSPDEVTDLILDFVA